MEAKRASECLYPLANYTAAHCRSSKYQFHKILRSLSPNIYLCSLSSPVTKDAPCTPVLAVYMCGDQFWGQTQKGPVHSYMRARHGTRPTDVGTLQQLRLINPVCTADCSHILTGVWTQRYKLHSPILALNAKHYISSQYNRRNPISYLLENKLRVHYKDQHVSAAPRQTADVKIAGNKLHWVAGMWGAWMFSGRFL